MAQLQDGIIVLYILQYLLGSQKLYNLIGDYSCLAIPAMIRYSSEYQLFKFGTVRMH